jgi:hypothetical protein
MHTFKWTGAALALMALGFAPRVWADTAQEMAGYCDPYRTAVVIGPNEIKVNSDANSQFCWGAFSVVQDLGTFVLYSDQGKAKGVALGLCLPPKSTRLELLKVFLRYSDQHPEHGHYSFGSVVVQALKEAFPCPVGAK